MSARQPFIPSRPVSRAAHSTVSENKNGLSKPLALRPAQIASGVQSATEQEGAATVVAEQYGIQTTVSTADGSNISALLTSVNKPLNLSGLVTRKSNRSPHVTPQNPQAHPWSSRKSFSATDESPRTPLPVANAQGPLHPAIGAFGRPASPFPVAPFKAPSLPGSRLATNTQSIPAAGGVTPERHQFGDVRYGSPPSMDRSLTSRSPLSPNAARTKPSAAPALEKIQESIEPNADTSSEQSQHHLRRVQKRTHANDGSDEDYGMELEAKRWRGSPVRRTQQDIYRGDFDSGGSRQPTPASHKEYPVSTTSIIDVDEDSNSFQASRRYAGSAAEAPFREAEARSSGLVLQQLLGLDPDTALDEYLAAYESAKRRWTQCSLEEWQSGADEMMGKFGEVMDYVKDHLQSKMSLYASLHSRVADHKEILGNRDKVLKDVRESLVRQSGNVLGSGIVP